MAHTAIRGLTTAMIHTFFRRVKVDGLERLPKAGPVILVANHANGLVDGILLMSMLPRWPRMLGKATLFKIAPLKPFLKAAGVIPVYRAKDAKPGEADRAAQNDATFAECRRLLAEGVMVAIFPEGISHDHETLQPLKTGAARIALTAVEQGASGLTIVPVGLAYDAKATFRSHAVITIGDPIPVDPWVSAAASEAGLDEREAVRECTAAITEGLRAVSPDHLAPPPPTAVTHRLKARRVPATIRANPSPVLIVSAPVALVGALIHFVPYQMVKRAARLPKGESIRSSVKLLGSTVLFFAEWLGIGAFAWRKRGPAAASVAIVAAPVSGYVAVRFAETVRDLLAQDRPSDAPIEADQIRR
ncbi:MAG: lysophospholipid acyltransferase family protein [Kofleriaceae bacterium]